MKNKIIGILVLVGALTLAVAYLLLFQPKEVLDENTGWPTGETISIFTEFKTAKEEYDLVKDIDYEEQKNEYDRLNSKLAFVESQISELEANLVNIKAERAEKELALRQEQTAIINEKANAYREQISKLEYEIANKQPDAPSNPNNPNTYLDATSDVVYSLMLQGLEGTTSDMVTFVGVNAEDGKYTVKLIGYFDSLTEVMDNITNNMDAYNISIGHCSFRQIYSCYNNMRPWDKITLLNWFNNSYVTESGGIGTVTGGYIVNGINVNGVLGADTIESLTKAKDKDIEEIQAFYQEMIDALEAERVDALIAACQGTDQDKVAALLAALNDYYDGRVAEVRAECEKKEAEILKTYNDRVAALQNPPAAGGTELGNPDLLIYTLDITFSVNAEK